MNDSTEGSAYMGVFGFASTRIRKESATINSAWLNVEPNQLVRVIDGVSRLGSRGHLVQEIDSMDLKPTVDKVRRRFALPGFAWIIHLSSHLHCTRDSAQIQMQMQVLEFVL